MLKNIQKYNIILASQSPRRQQMLKELGLEFQIKTKNVEEIYPENISREEIPVYLSELKAKAFENEMADNDLIITADTIVCVDSKVLGKPIDYDNAYDMLSSMSGRSHSVISGVSIISKEKKISFSSTTKVYFKKLSSDEIHYYVKNYKPYDKAGAYGIQEWIGFVGIEKIEGSYFNVVGLPIQRLYEELAKF